MADTLIEAAQRLLVVQGHDPGPIDGIRGPRTEAAAQAWLAQIAPTSASPAPDPAPMAWDARSARALIGVHPDLVRVASRARALSPRPFVVIEGRRSIEQQKKNLASGASRTLNSRHLTGHAIDCTPLDDRGEISWDWALYPPMAAAFRRAASELGVALVWGGDWKGLRDGPHFELDRAAYPA